MFWTPIHVKRLGQPGTRVKCWYYDHWDTRYYSFDRWHWATDKLTAWRLASTTIVVETAEHTPPASGPA